MATKKRGNAKAGHSLTAVRVTKFQIDKVIGQEWRDATRRWRELCEDVQQATNFIWRMWEQSHVANGSEAKIRDALDAMKAWHNADKATRGEKPKFSLFAMSNELSAELYKQLGERFPHIARHVIALILNGVKQKIMQCKSATGNLPGWWSVLLCRQGRPSSIHPLPFPFDTQDAELEPPKTGEKNFLLNVRAWRDEPKKGKATGSTVLDRIELRCEGRNVQSQVSILKRIVSGEFAFRGSQIFERDKKWFVAICYRMPATVKAEGLKDDRVAVLRPSTLFPFRLLIQGREFRCGGSGEYVGLARKRLLHGRWQRQEGYRHAGGSTKGHGRDRALAGQMQFFRTWKNFVKRCNHGIARSIVNDCVRRGVGKLVYLMPESQKEAAFLTISGKTGRNDSTGWDWFQFEALLAQKCVEVGIHLEKSSESERRNARKARAEKKKRKTG